MNTRRIPATRWLSFLLVLTQLWIAAPIRAQDPSPADDHQANDQSTTTTAEPALEPFQSSSTYYPESTEPSTYGEPSFGLIRPIPESELGSTPQYGVPYSSLYPLTGADGESVDPLAIHSLNVDSTQSTKIGGAEGTISLGSFGGGFLPTLPFIPHGFPPDDADLKLGPLYLKFDSLEADMIYTDNYRFSTHDRRSELLAIISLNMTLMAQITEDIQFAVNGTLIYLPIQNIVAFDTSANQLQQIGLPFLLLASPLLTSQITYDTMIAGWPVRFADQFMTTMGSYSDGTRDSFGLFEADSLHQSNNSESYTFHSGHTDLRDNNFVSNNQNDYFTAYSNTVSAYTSNYLPGDVQLTARALRTDLWYNQGSRGLPTSRDDFYVIAEPNRPNLRFTPFISYDINHTSDVPGVYQTLWAGLFGPITDQLYLLAKAGYFWSNTGHEDALWSLDLWHDPTPDTRETLALERGLDYWNDEVVTTEYYNIRQTLGPTLSAFAFADHSDFQELAGNQFPDRSQEDVGIGFEWTLGPLTSLNISGVYTHQDYSDGFLADSWSGRLTLTRTVSDTLFLRVLYQYQRYTVNQPNSGYYANFVFVGLTKIFP